MNNLTRFTLFFFLPLICLAVFLLVPAKETLLAGGKPEDDKVKINLRFTKDEEWRQKVQISFILDKLHMDTTDPIVAMICPPDGPKVTGKFEATFDLLNKVKEVNTDGSSTIETKISDLALNGNYEVKPFVLTSIEIKERKVIIERKMGKEPVTRFSFDDKEGLGAEWNAILNQPFVRKVFLDGREEWPALKDIAKAYLKAEGWNLKPEPVEACIDALGLLFKNSEDFVKPGSKWREEYSPDELNKAIRGLFSEEFGKQLPLPSHYLCDAKVDSVKRKGGSGAIVTVKKNFSVEGLTDKTLLDFIAYKYVKSDPNSKIDLKLERPENANQVSNITLEEVYDEENGKRLSQKFSLELAFDMKFELNFGNANGGLNPSGVLRGKFLGDILVETVKEEKK